MPKEIAGTFDNIRDQELLRRDFFRKHYDQETGEWSFNTFQLRDLTPPENFVSLARVIIAPDAVEYAKKVYSSGRLKKIAGYTQLKAREVRALETAPLEIALLTTDFAENAHAGLYAWNEDGLLIEGSVENPNILRLKKDLFCLALPTYTDYPKGAFTAEEGSVL